MRTHFLLAVVIAVVLQGCVSSAPTRRMYVDPPDTQGMAKISIKRSITTLSAMTSVVTFLGHVDKSCDTFILDESPDLRKNSVLVSISGPVESAISIPKDFRIQRPFYLHVFEGAGGSGRKDMINDDVRILSSTHGYPDLSKSDSVVTDFSVDGWQSWPMELRPPVMRVTVQRPSKTFVMQADGVESTQQHAHDASRFRFPVWSIGLIVSKGGYGAVESVLATQPSARFNVPTWGASDSYRSGNKLYTRYKRQIARVTFRKATTVGSIAMGDTLTWYRPPGELKITLVRRCLGESIAMTTGNMRAEAGKSYEFKWYPLPFSIGDSKPVLELNGQPVLLTTDPGQQNVVSQSVAPESNIRGVIQSYVIGSTTLDQFHADRKSGGWQIHSVQGQIVQDKDLKDSEVLACLQHWHADEGGVQTVVRGRWRQSNAKSNEL